jgi:pimeloyl-ACP methyl ester carboxylesterase
MPTTNRRLGPAVLVALLAGCTVQSRPVPPTTEGRPAGEGTMTRAEATAIVADLGKIDTTEGIESLRPVQLGGITQWISIRGRHRSNPILLFVHGGPGSPMMPASWFFQTPWEEYFTVVQWDQRGAGKTAAANEPATVTPTISLDRMVADGEELIAYLRRTFDQPKIFLMGHSWGTIIGVNLAQRHPDWLYAYIGMGQAVNSHDNERAGFEWALAEAKRGGDQTAIKELEALEPYPDPDGSVGVRKILTQRKWVIAYGGLTWHRSDFRYEGNAAKLSPDYTPQDLAALDRQDLGSLTQLIGAMSNLHYDQTALSFGCPVFVFGGRYDYETVTSVAKAWFDKIAAPKKEFVFFEHSAHMLPFEEPGKLFLHLVEDVRPLAPPIGP